MDSSQTAEELDMDDGFYDVAKTICRNGRRDSYFSALFASTMSWRHLYLY